MMAVSDSEGQQDSTRSRNENPEVGDRPPVIFLMGPTASGKTDLAIRLRKYLPVDLISVDSSQVYRGMDIGAAKPSAEELAQAPHRLLDIRDPAEPYSVSEFLSDVMPHIEAITGAGRIPLLVGGTMLYFKALLEGLADLPAGDARVRARIEALAEKHGWAYVHGCLQAVDPLSAEKIHPNHSQRIARALEIYELSGVPMSELIARQARGDCSHPPITRDYRLIQLALLPGDRGQLHRHIEQRFERMLELGFEAEVQRLFQRGDLHPDLPAIRAVGYRQMWAYLSGECSYEQMKATATAATRQLAKRQLTWLRSWPDLFCLGGDGEQEDSVSEQTRAFLQPQLNLTNALKILEKAAIYIDKGE